MKNYRIYGGALLLCVGIFVPLSSAHAAQCVFTRTLELETTGEDVRCLQQFLNDQGFTIAESGVGSKGHETNQYKEKTKEAVKKWQKAVGISPATGNFGPLSKSKYEAGFVITPTPTTPTSTSSKPVVPATPAVSTTETTSKKQLIKALELVDSFDQYIDDHDNGGKNLDDKKKVLTKVQGYVLDATRAYLNGTYSKVSEFTAKITDALDKYSDDLEATDDKDGAKQALKEAKDTLDSVTEKIKKAKDRKKDVEDAENELDTAKDHYKNARDAYNSEDYADVFDFINDFDDSIKDALDAL
ncbi:MAG: trimeric autotransporter adhesin [Candidatus Parcubacteria bacterium]|jgi:peptidoglycan hydrolase-like protein with peptidoglycan-binding domain